MLTCLWKKRDVRFPQAARCQALIKKLERSGASGSSLQHRLSHTSEISQPTLLNICFPF